MKTASIVSGENCELLCTIGGTMLFTVIKSCYPTAFYIESMSTTDKIIYSICSNDVINWSSKMVLMALNTSCDVWGEKKLKIRKPNLYVQQDINIARDVHLKIFFEKSCKRRRGFRKIKNKIPRFVEKNNRCRRRNVEKS